MLLIGEMFITMLMEKLQVASGNVPRHWTFRVVGKIIRSVRKRPVTILP